MRLAPALFVLVVSLALTPVSAAATGGGGACRALGHLIERAEAKGSPSAPILARVFARGCVRMNQLQVLGSHNSYHEKPAPRLDTLLGIADAFVPGCGGASNPCPSELALVWEYTHLPLDEQLALQGIRQLELDVFLDPGLPTLYANPLGNLLASLFLPPPPDPPHDPDGLLAEPGFKVLHVQDLDFRSNCLTLVRCLEIVQQWSAANPWHLPVLVLIELKEEAIANLSPPFPPFVVPPLYTAEDLDDLDAEIRSIFPSEQLITPGDVRGRRSNLEQAVLARGWPRLRKARGRVVFALDNGGEIRDLYIADHPSLAGRVLFTNSPVGTPEAAFLTLNDPVADFDEIQQRVAQGYLIRTRADSDTIEARFDDSTRRDDALASGAQFVSTDYPVPNPDFGTDYFVAIPEGDPGRCNPINAPPGCRNAALEFEQRWPGRSRGW